MGTVLDHILVKGNGKQKIYQNPRGFGLWDSILLDKAGAFDAKLWLEADIFYVRKEWESVCKTLKTQKGNGKM